MYNKLLVENQKNYCKSTCLDEEHLRSKYFALPTNQIKSSKYDKDCSGEDRYYLTGEFARIYFHIKFKGCENMYFILDNVIKHQIIHQSNIMFYFYNKCTYKEIATSSSYHLNSCYYQYFSAKRNHFD